MTSTCGNEKKKWTREAILCLIEAYKEEPCLYAVDTPNYHNKQLRNNAIKNVCTAVSMLRPGITEHECAQKFHSLRTQFHVENAKVKLSMKSGIGTNNVYKPNLWYFNNLKYLDAYFKPRKSRNSIEKNSTQESLIFNQNEELSRTEQPSEINVSEQPSEINDYKEVLDEEWLDEEYLIENSNDKSITESYTALFYKPSESVTSVNNQFSPNNHTATFKTHDRISTSTTSTSINIPRPASSVSSASSIASSSESNNIRRSPQVNTTKKRKSISNTDNVYAGAIEALADSLKQPVIVKSTDASANKSSLFINNNNVSDSVDACMTFIGLLLKQFKNKKFKLDVMNTLIQTVINASTENVEEIRHN